MINIRFGAFQPVQIISAETHTCVGEEKLQPELKTRLFGYSSDGLFSKDGRCLSIAFLMLALFMITACSDRSIDSGTVITQPKENIKTYSLSYKAGIPQVIHGGKYVISTNTIPQAAKVLFSMDTSQTGITIDRTTGKITIDGTAEFKKYTFNVTVTVPETNESYTGTKSIPVSFEVVDAVSYKPDAVQWASRAFFTVGDIGSPALIALNGITDVSKVSDQKIEIKVQGSTTPLFNGTYTSKASFNGKVTIGLPVSKITYANFKAITNDATVDITFNAKIDGVNIAKTFSKTKKPATDIYSWRDLSRIDDDRDLSYTLKNDLAFPADNTYGYTDRFTPLLTFYGNFDGNHKTISGLKIISPADYTGLFSLVSGAYKRGVIKNLFIDHKGISGDSNVGALAGSITSGAKILNVWMISNSGALIKGNKSVGGLVGHTQGSTLTGYANSAVSGKLNVGGLVGYANAGSVVNGNSTGAISGNQYVGGLVGFINSNSKGVGYATGEVNCNVSGTGGLVGTVQDNSSVVGYATGAVNSSDAIAGGLVGYAMNSSVSGFATGAVSGNNHVGGLIGKTSNSSYVTGYARGKITRKSGTDITFGKLSGNIDGTIKGYHSTTESSLADSNGTALNDKDTSGDSGTAITIKTDFKAKFSDFTFVDVVNNWNWVNDGNWPALYLPLEVGVNYKKEKQPTAP